MDLNQLLHKLRGSLTVLKSDIFFIEKSGFNKSEHLISAKNTINEMADFLAIFEILEKIEKNELMQSQSFIILQDIVKSVVDQSDIVEYNDEAIPYTIYADKKYLTILIEQLLDSTISFTGNAKLNVLYDNNHFKLVAISSFREFTSSEKKSIFNPYTYLPTQKGIEQSMTGMGFACIKALCLYNGWRFELSRRNQENVFSIIF